VELKNEFSVATPIENAWPMLLDVASIVHCVPGGELLEQLDERSFKGRVSVKLGPMLLNFEGIAKFVEIDVPARRARIDARGTDTKGRGAAQAKVKLQLEPDGSSTKVSILTDLQLSGSVAQIGRASGLIEEVSQHLIGEFADNLDRRIAGGSSATAAAPAETPAPISGFRLAVQVVRGMLARLFRRVRAG
jgi:carbon monoxide dehydrogenase subunit G